MEEELHDAIQQDNCAGEDIEIININDEKERATLALEPEGIEVHLITNLLEHNIVVKGIDNINGKPTTTIILHKVEPCTIEKTVEETVLKPV